jgi:hypothetical protein
MRPAAATTVTRPWTSDWKLSIIAAPDGGGASAESSLDWKVSPDGTLSSLASQSAGDASPDGA